MLHTSCQVRAVRFGSVFRNPVASARPKLYARRSLALAVKAAIKPGDSLKDSPDYYRKLTNSEGVQVSLDQFRGKPLVVFFYPKAGTPGCTKEVCAFRDRYGEFSKAGVQVVGISGDGPEAQAAFKSAQGLPFQLLTDASDIMRKGLGIKADLFGMLPGRQTFVFNPEGKCVLSFNDQLNAEKHVTEALAAIKSMA